MKARASRSAVMVASVPVDTSRTFSAGGHARARSLGQLDLGQRRGAEAQATAGCLAHGLDDLGVRVAEEGRAPGADEVDVLGCRRRR